MREAGRQKRVQGGGNNTKTRIQFADETLEINYKFI